MSIKRRRDETQDLRVIYTDCLERGLNGFGHKYIAACLGGKSAKLSKMCPGLTLDWEWVSAALTSFHLGT